MCERLFDIVILVYGYEQDEVQMIASITNVGYINYLAQNALKVC
jgi:hypothetical protein